MLDRRWRRLQECCAKRAGSQGIDATAADMKIHQSSHIAFPEVAECFQNSIYKGRMLKDIRKKS